MIKKLKIGLLVAVLSFALVGFNSASAAAITYSADTTVDLSSPDINLTILSGSVATTTVVNAGTVVVTVPASGTFTITSADKQLLATGESAFGVVVTSCSSSLVSSMVITPTAGAAETITVTPSSLQCVIAGGGGGGNGGSGGGSVVVGDTTSPIGTVSINAGALTTASLSATLALSATDAVGVTQMLISNDAGFAGASWETFATSKAWTLTSGDGVKTVYAKFRDAALNMSAAVSASVTVSGSNTVAVVVTTPAPVNGCSGGNLYNTSTGAACINNAVPQGCSGGNAFNTSTGASCTNNAVPGCSGGNAYNTSTGAVCVNNAGNVSANESATGTGHYNLGTPTLKNGSKGEAVKELQRLLNKVLDLGLVVDGKLGPKTIAVIKKWQKAHALVADGLVGKLTKAAMKLEADSN